MLKIIGAIFVAGIVLFLPINAIDNNITEDETYAKAYRCAKEEIDEDDDRDDLEDPFTASSYFFWWSGCGSSYDVATVYTPNGSAVEAKIDKRTMSERDKANCNKKGDDKVPQATRIADSTNRYNCHSYAWYQQSTDNPYWIDDPSAYYTDGSYIQVSTPHINDRICYFNKSGENIHSGIIIDAYSGYSNGICGNSDLVKVISKWGTWGLYEHRGDQCPYSPSYGGDAVTVKYYHRHDYSYSYTYASDSQHFINCICGESITESHNFVVQKTGYTADLHTVKCSECGAIESVSHSYKYQKKNALAHTLSCACGKSMVEAHSWKFYSNIPETGDLKTVQCRYCNFVTKIRADDTIIGNYKLLENKLKV